MVGAAAAAGLATVPLAPLLISWAPGVAAASQGLLECEGNTGSWGDARGGDGPEVLKGAPMLASPQMGYQRGDACVCVCGGGVLVTDSQGMWVVAETQRVLNHTFLWLEVTLAPHLAFGFPEVNL